MSGYKIPFFGIQRQYHNLRQELLEVTDQVYQTGQVLDGPHTKSFEVSMARRCHRQFAVSVNSCTQGLISVLQASIPRESRVMIPTLSFAATLNSVIMSGHTPVFCDTDQNGLIDLESNDFALNGSGVNTIMYANLFGHTVDWNRFRVQTDFFNKDMFVIEDAAQSFGASYQGTPAGKMGDVSVLSFDPTKNLNNYGSGGMILTDNFSLYETLLDLRDNGKHSAHSGIGTNSKMSEADSAQMLVKLKYFDAWQRRRQSIADYYISELAEYVDVVMPGMDVISAWSKFVIRLGERHGLQKHLAEAGIDTRFHYDRPLFELPVGYDYIDYARELFRESVAFSRECLSLPVYPELTDGEIEYICEKIIEYLR